MFHPIFGNKKFFFAYLVAWGIILFSHALFLYLVLDFSLTISLIDAGVFSILFLLIGIGVWFPIQFLIRSKYPDSKLILNHFLLAAGSVLSWIFVGEWILTFFEATIFDFNTLPIKLLAGRTVTGFLFYGIILLVYFLMQSQIKLKEKIKRENELLHLATRAELDMLKAQVNPHFLFNSLNSIHVLNNLDPAKASHMILELSDFLRFSLKQNQNIYQTLTEELANIQRYLNIEKIRFGDKISFHLDIETTCQSCLIPQMILQPLFENAVKHGLNSGVELLEINASAKLINGDLVLEIRNNIGESLRKSVGNQSGLENIRKRLLLHYYQPGLLQIRKTKTEFIIELIIPLNQNGNN